jgi:hypothetical protein
VGNYVFKLKGKCQINVSKLETDVIRRDDGENGMDKWKE